MAIPFLSDAKFLRLHKLKFHSTGEITTTGASGTNFDISAIGSNTDLRFLADNDDGSSSVYFLLDASMADYTTPDYYTRFPDNSHLVFGNSANTSSLDFEIYHAGTTAYLQGDSSIYIASENLIQLNADNGVELRHNNSRKIHTTTTGVDVTGTINLDNLTINGAQGSDGQVLTSTGSGIAWEDAAGGASLSGGAANKLAIWTSATALTNDTNLHWNTTNDQLGIGNANPQAKLDITQTATAQGIIIRSSSVQPEITFIDGATDDSFAIGHNRAGSRMDIEINGADTHTFKQNGNVGFGTTNPDRPLVVSETRTGSTASDAYTTVVKSVQSSGASPNPGTGGLKVQYTSSSSNVHAFGLVAGSSSSDFLTTGPMHFYTNSDLDTVSATGFAMQLDTSQRLILGSMTASQKLNVSGNVTADRYYGNGSTVYYVDPNDSTTSAILNGKVGIGTTSPSAKLNVSGTNTGAAIDWSNTTATTGRNFRWVSLNSGGFAIEDLTAGGANRLTVGSTGNVGIGTTSPGYKLDVQGQIRLKNPNHQVIFHDTDSGVDEWSITTYSNTGLSFFDGATTGSAVMTLLSGGNVGINVTNPGFKLDVSGTVRSNSDFRAPRFYDTDDTGYYLDPSSTSLLRHVDFKNGAVTKWYRSGANALQRADARVENSTTARLHWYGSNDSGGNTAFQHAWYDGSNYINVTASNPGVITFAGSAASMYIGSDRVFDDGYHPNADQWTTGRTLTIGSTGKTVTGGANVSWTLAEIGAAAAGDENIIDGALSIWNADGDGDVFTYNDANPAHNGKTVGAVINIKGDGAENGSLVRAGVYTGDHISVSRGYYVGTELNTTGATTQKVIDSVGNLIVGPDTVDIRSGTISVGGDANTYYPVVWYYNTQSQAFLNKIQIYRNYNETAPNSWNTSTHKGGLLLDLQANWGGWGGVNYDIKVNEFSELYSTMVGKISHFANNRGFAIWLRGGTATYHFYTEGPTTNPTVQLSAYDPGNNSTGVSSITSLDTGNINNRLYFRGGTLYSQNSQVLTVANEGSGNGIDADTVDGIQGGSFLRSDANDSFTGDELHFPTLDLSISNNNSQNNGNTYFRGTGTHFVLGLNNGNTCYLNYGNTSGALRLYGSSIYWNDSNIGTPWGSGNDGAGTGLDADTVDGIQGGSFLRSDTADTATGIITINNDLHLGTYSGTTQARLFLNGTTANKQAKLQCTNGNLHIDSEDGHSLYLNYYEGTTDNVIIGNGNGGASGTILKSTGRINAGEHVIANNNVYSGAGYFVFGTSTGEGEYIARSGDTLTFYSGGAIKFDITPSNGVHVRNGTSYFAQISNTGVGRFANDVVAFYNFSDKRLKTNIKPTTDNLDKVLKLNPVEYNWKEGYRKDKKEIGLIAQEVEKIIPEVVRENQRLNDDTLYKQVDYEHLVSTLIGAVQEQQKQIDELKSIINGRP